MRGTGHVARMVQMRIV